MAAICNLLYLEKVPNGRLPRTGVLSNAQHEGQRHSIRHVQTVKNDENTMDPDPSTVRFCMEQSSSNSCGDCWIFVANNNSQNG